MSWGLEVRGWRFEVGGWRFEVQGSRLGVAGWRFEVEQVNRKTRSYKLCKEVLIKISVYTSPEISNFNSDLILNIDRLQQLLPVIQMKRDQPVLSKVF